ncbi:HipA family kinase [Thiococcus pfennigii]|uniref:HipA family kinase n=1 Tax=Thiococcus pfennigii TaxID=1057 RepID=UPI001907B50D|nr:HipA family kinase [Thiococcus pfennigii]MBK1699767.1 hypothetical protein [Thiococcus pfennigii]
MEPVGLGTLFLAPRPVTDRGNVSPLWHGNALTHSGETRLFLKHAPPGEMLSECLCAVLGRRLNLPVPRAFLVLDPQRYTGHELLIGSEDANAPSLRHYIERDDPGVQRALARWGRLADAAIFDEWIHNPDRNLGNLLWDGALGWHLIDHARALGAWPADAPVPEACRATEPNGLARFFAAHHGDVGVMRMRKRCAEILPETLEFEEIIVATMSDILAQGARAELALSCLERRAKCVAQLLGRYAAQHEMPL